MQLFVPLPTGRERQLIADLVHKECLEKFREDNKSADGADDIGAFLTVLCVSTFPDINSTVLL